MTIFALSAVLLNRFWIGSYIDKKKKRLKTRIDVLHDILENIENFSKELYYSYCKLNRIESDFRYINYAEFVNNFQQYCKNNPNINELMHEDLLYEVEILQKEVSILDESKVAFLTEGVFTHNEMEAIHYFNDDLKHSLSTDEEKRATIIVTHIHEWLSDLCENIKEINDLVESFGKDELVSVYEFGTLKQIWVRKK